MIPLKNLGRVLVALTFPLVTGCSAPDEWGEDPAIRTTSQTQVAGSVYGFSSDASFGDPAKSDCDPDDIEPMGYPEPVQVPEPETGEQSISFWFFAHNLDHPAHSLVSKGNAVSSHSGWRFFIENRRLVFRVGARDPSTGARYKAGTSKAVSEGRWYHVIGVIDRQLPGEADDRAQVRLYLDDDFYPQPSGAAGAESRFFDMPDSASVTSPQPLRIGWTRNPENEHHMCSSGFVTDLHIYPRALSRSDISSLYDDHPERHKEERSPDVVDSANFALDSEKEFGVPGLSSCSASSIDDLGYPDPVQIQDPGVGETSVSFWFYARDFEHEVHSLVAKGNAVSGHSGWRFFIEGDKLVFRVGLRDPNTGARYKAATTKAVVPGRWYHAVGVIDRHVPGEDDDREQVRLYLDDAFSPQPSGGGGASSRFLDVPGTAAVTSPQPLRIGWTRNPDNEDHMCSNGKITGLRVYDRALSRSEITEMAGAEFPMKTDTLLFDPDQDEFNIPYHSFRIPSLIQTKTGTLLAFAEGRACSHADFGNINLVYKRSVDGGKSWSALREVVGSGPGTWGNPTSVVDQESGRIWLFLNWNDATKSQFGHTNPCTNTATTVVGVGDRPVYVTWSDDDGETWAKPLKQNASQGRDFQPTTKSWDAVGPGIGIQLQDGPHKGRLIIPAIGRNIYSDDGGNTWTYQGFSASTSEGTVVELSDGSLFRNDRPVRLWDQSKTRWGARGSIEGGFPTFEPQLALIDPRVEGSSLVYSRSPHRILFANPASTAGRCRMRIRMSTDDGYNWPVSRALHDQVTPQETCSEKLGGYSSVATDSNGDIGVLSERQESDGSRSIEFHRFNIEWLLAEPAN